MIAKYSNLLPFIGLSQNVYVKLIALLIRYIQTINKTFVALFILYHIPLAVALHARARP